LDGCATVVHEAVINGTHSQKQNSHEANDGGGKGSNSELHEQSPVGPNENGRKVTLRRSKGGTQCGGRRPTLQKRMMSGASAGSPLNESLKTGRLLPLPRPAASHASAPGAAAVNDPEHLREQLAVAHAQIAELRRQQQAILTVECVAAVCVSCAIRSTHARTHT